MSTSTFWYADFRPGTKGYTHTRASVATEQRDVLAATTPTLQRPIFCYPIRSDEGTYSGGSYESTLPVSNAADALKSKVARSTDATTANTQFDLDLGDTYKLGMVVIDGHNLSADGLVRVRVSDESDVDPAVYDSGWLSAYREALPSGLLTSGEDGFLDGMLTTAQLADLNASGRSVPHIQFLPAEVEGRYLRVEFDDTANSDGYVEFGRVYVGPTFQSPINFTPGLREGVVTETKRLEMDGGAEHVIVRARRRRLVGTLDQVAEDEAYVRLHDFMQLAGKSNLFFFVKDPTATVHLYRGSFQARLDELSALTEPNVISRRRLALAIREAL